MYSHENATPIIPACFLALTTTADAITGSYKVIKSNNQHYKEVVGR
jgi:hypothetical protein